jgi:hypothetical protein
MTRLFIRRKDASKNTKKKTSALLLPLKGRKVKIGTPLYDYKGKLIKYKKK